MAVCKEELGFGIGFSLRCQPPDYFQRLLDQQLTVFANCPLIRCGLADRPRSIDQIARVTQMGFRIRIGLDPCSVLVDEFLRERRGAEVDGLHLSCTKTDGASCSRA